MVAILTVNPYKNALKPGKSGIVSQFSDDQLGSKLLTMGVLPGSQVEIVREAPFGGGVVIKVDNNYLALRKQEAECILLK
ncbi:MAG: FeoA family protein [Saprospiraceae bacterium]|nr:FeoA family protein [Saprospiraceae bacterium]